MWIFTLSGQWRFGVEEAQRLKVYTGPTNNGRFLNEADLFYGNETGGVLSLGSW